MRNRFCRIIIVDNLRATMFHSKRDLTVASVPSSVKGQESPEDGERYLLILYQFIRINGLLEVLRESSDEKLLSESSDER